MLDMLVEAKFIYRNCTITAHRTVDTESGKFFCWYGEFDSANAIAQPTLEEFEQAFRKIVDKCFYTESYTAH